MTFKPVHWKSACDHNRSRLHVWMCYSHNNGWKQLGVFCVHCGTRSYMSDRQWVLWQAAAEEQQLTPHGD